MKTAERIEYTVTPYDGVEKEWLELTSYESLEDAKAHKKEVEIEEDTQAVIRVYKITELDELTNLLTKTKKIVGKELIEIIKN